MDNKVLGEKVTCIIPFYNEADRLPIVLDVICAFPFAEIIAVDDGSTDGSADVAERYASRGVRVLRLSGNRGKAQAMDAAVLEAKTPYVFFADADVVGLRTDVIARIVEPVVSGEYEMCIGMRNRKIFVLQMMLHILPLLGGERALTVDLWKRVPARYKDRFRIEAALNFYAKYHGRGFAVRVFRGLSQVIKERKFGFWEGQRRRWAMTWDIIVADISLLRMDVPAEVANIRKTLRILVATIFMTLLGAILLIAAIYGPVDFVYTFFGKELREDPNAYISQFFLFLAQVVSNGVFALSGIILLWSNGLATILQSIRLVRLLRQGQWTFKSLLLKSDLKNQRIYHD